MKDAHRRRWKAENAIIKALPGVDPSQIVTPIHQKRLVGTGGAIRTVDVQANEFIATSSLQWPLAMYSVAGDDDEGFDDAESASELTDVSGESGTPSDIKSPRWYRVLPSGGQYTNRVLFITKDVVASFEREAGGVISTWCTRSSLRIDSLTIRRSSFFLGICKLNETEFLVGGLEGHLNYISHKNGYDLVETKRIWKAHQCPINAIVFRDEIIVSTSDDWTAKIWDAKNKTQLSTLYHNGPVHDATISDRYILTHEEDAQTLRVFANSEAFPLVKVFRTGGIESLKFLNNGLLTYWSAVGINRMVLCFLKSIVNAFSVN